MAIPKHTLFRCIGRGSYGSVWLGQDDMSKWRAVKIIGLQSHAHADHVYEREFKAIQLYEEICHSHGSLMTIHFVGRDEEKGFFYTMELADDANTQTRLDSHPSIEEAKARINAYQPKTLRVELRRQGRLLVQECVQCGIALAEALAALHDNDLIHRDIKPDNIIFVHGQPKLADVGLVMDAQATYSLAGTNAYLSPEPVRGQPADIFAMGKVLYEMVSGRDVGEFPAPPLGFDALTDAERSSINELYAVILKACQPEVEQRYSSAKALKEELQLLRQGESVLRLRELEERDDRRRRIVRLLALVSVASIVISGFVILSILVWAGRSRLREENRRRQLTELQLSRTDFRFAGWRTNNLDVLQQAAKVRKDNDLLRQATAVLAGIDGRNPHFFDNASGTSVAFSPDGRALIGPLGTNHAAIVDTNGIRTQLPITNEGIVCWDTNGVPLIFQSSGTKVSLIEAESGLAKWHTTIPSWHMGTQSLLALTPTADKAAAVVNGQIFVWDVGRNQLITSKGVLATAITFNPDGSLLGLGNADGVVRVFTLPEFTEVATLQSAERGSTIRCLAFARDPVIRYENENGTNSWLLAAGDQAADITIWDLTRNQPRSYCRGSPWTVATLAFDPNGLLLASGGRNEGRLWDVATGQTLLRLGGAGSGETRAICFDKTGRRLIFTGEPGAGTARTALWQLEPHRGIHTLRGLYSTTRRLWFSPDGKKLAALSDNWHAGVWDLHTGRALFFETPEGTSADTGGGGFDRSGNQFAFSAGTEARLYSLVNGATRRKWLLPDGEFDELQFAESNRLLLLRREIAEDPHRKKWRLYYLSEAGPQVLHQQTDSTWSCRNLAFAPGGKYFLAWSDGPDTLPKTIRGYSTETGLEVWQAPLESRNGHIRVRLDPSGHFFAYSPAQPGPPRVIQFDSFHEVGVASPGLQTIGPYCEQFVGDGKLLAKSLGEHMEMYFGMDWHPMFDALSFSADGKSVAWGTDEGIVLVADIAEVKARVHEFMP